MGRDRAADESVAQGRRLGLRNADGGPPEPSLCQSRTVASDHGQWGESGGTARYRRAAPGRARRRTGADHVRQRGERIHGRARGHRPWRRRSADRRRLAARRPGGGVAEDGGPLGFPSPVRQAVHRRELHDRAPGHRPGHPPLSRLRPRQGHRPRLRRPHHPALRPRHPPDHRGGAQAADRGSRARTQADEEDHRGLGGAEGDQGGHALPPDRRGVDVHRGPHLQEVRRRLHLRRQEPALPPRHRRLGHRLPHRRQDRPVRRHPARQPGARQGRSPVRPFAVHRPGPLLPPRGAADRRRGEAAPGGHGAGHRVPRGAGGAERGGRRARRRTGAAARPRRRGPGDGHLPRPLPPRRTLPLRPAVAPPAHRPGPDARLPRRRLGQGARLAQGAYGAELAPSRRRPSGSRSPRRSRS